MRNVFLLLTFYIFITTLSLQAFDYVPKNVDTNPFADNKQDYQENSIKTPEIREIKNLNEYFRYLPAEVHRNWIPYKADYDYTVTVEFRVHRDGTISDTQIVKSDCLKANSSVLKTVKTGVPYQPLPKSFTKDCVKAQIVLEYHNKK